ncbi:hypothetical protein C7M84_015804 [Penaeus vannamei]|uniref:Sulfatase N-terminal domain-containing protein n=1 Tax=Penaeus vannamei TaxID=6689 RepID=A0A3R7LW86_PENVA|nr:hypothetical protein C7M84_015804 [Penaeus vannamei]
MSFKGPARPWLPLCWRCCGCRRCLLLLLPPLILPPTSSSFWQMISGLPLGSHTPTGLAVHHTLLPERLSRLGYSTHMIGKWHLGFCDWAYTPLERGFDTFYGYYGGSEFHFNHTVTNGYDFRDQREPDFTANGTYATHLFGDRAVRIIEEHQPATSLALQNVHKPLEVRA